MWNCTNNGLDSLSLHELFIRTL